MPPGLWALNAARSFAGVPSGHPDSGLKARAAAVGPFEPSLQRGSDRLARLRGPRVAVAAQAAPRPTWRAIRLHAVGPLIRGHDVSGTGWQIVGRAMRSITTIVPTWQCGHCRRDCPVNCLETVAVVSRRLGSPGRCHPEQFPAQRKLARTMAIAEEAVVPDAVKPVRQYMDQEAADETPRPRGSWSSGGCRPGSPSSGSGPCRRPWRPGGCWNMATRWVLYPPDIVEDLCRSGERPLRVDHPIGVPAGAR